MSYKSALIAAGAEILEFANFGDYQGQWFAKVRYNGETGWIQDWFGSCTYCDAFEREFGYDDGYGEDKTNEQRLADFGKRYLGTILPAGHFLPIVDEQAEWDINAAEAASWIRFVEDQVEEGKTYLP